MKKTNVRLFIHLTVCCLLANLLSVAAEAQQFRQAYGFGIPGTAITIATQAQSATANWMAVGWFPAASKTVSEVSLYASAINGTLSTSGDVTLDICSSSSGLPGTCNSGGNPLATSTTLTGAVSSAGWITWSISYAMTANTQYWFVAHPTGTTNYPTFRWLTSTGFSSAGGGFTGSTVKTSTNSGTTWTVSPGSTGAIRVKYSDGTYAGYPLSNAALSNSSTNERVYSTHELGVKYTAPWPAGLTLNVHSIAVAFEKVSSPTGNVFLQVYSSSGGTETPVASSVVQLAPGDVDTTVRNVAFRFTSPVGFVGQTAYTVALKETTQSDGSSLYYSVNAITVDTDSHSTPLLPFGGTLMGYYCLGGPGAAACTITSNWVSTPNIMMFGLLTDPSAEFTVTASGGAQTVN